MSDDDVIDYLIMEAVAIKSQREENKQQKQAEKRNWKKDSKGLDHLKQYG